MFQVGTPPVPWGAMTSVSERLAQFCRRMVKMSSTCRSSAPIISVVLPSRRKPPVVASLVTPMWASASASMALLASLSRITANISFMV